jgi:hypothetical protein
LFYEEEGEDGWELEKPEAILSITGGTTKAFKKMNEKYKKA